MALKEALPPPPPLSTELTFEELPGKYLVHPSGTVYRVDSGEWRRVKEPLASKIREKAKA